MKRLALLAALLLCSGCNGSIGNVSSLLAPRTPALADSSITLSVATTDTTTIYTLSVRGYGSYDRASGWFLTGIMVNGLLLHGVYAGEDVPSWHDYLWLSDNPSGHAAPVPVSISRGTSDFMTVTVPFKVVPPSPIYSLRVWRIDENLELAYLVRQFDGTANQPL